MITVFKSLFDIAFGSVPIRKLVLFLFGYRWNGWLLGFIGYRAVYMVKPGDSCILAGIFAESTIKSYARAVGIHGRVIVVEANPLNVARLKKKTATLKNVRIANRAIWREKGELDFLMSSQDKVQGYNRLSHTEIQNFPIQMDRNPETIKVPTDTLDNIAKEFELERVSHINLTINGAELQALEAIVEIQKANPKVRLYMNSERR